jgi:hypothetical protein
MATAASPVRAQGRLVDQATDRVTGAVIRVYKTPQGSRVDVVGKDVELRKELMGTTVVTTVKTAGDWLTIRAETNKLTVSGRRSSAFVSRTDQTGASAVSQIVAASEAARRAAVLIGRLGLGEQSPLRPVLMTTRAMFMAAGGDETGTRELVRWIREERVRTVRVGWQERTPTECWREYQKECAAAFDDMGYCLDHVKWWNPFGGLGCEVTYDLRLLGAFTWYLNCVKLLPLIGG